MLRGLLKIDRVGVALYPTLGIETDEEFVRPQALLIFLAQLTDLAPFLLTLRQLQLCFQITKKACIHKLCESTCDTCFVAIFLLKSVFSTKNCHRFHRFASNVRIVCYIKPTTFLLT